MLKALHTNSWKALASGVWLWWSTRSGAAEYKSQNTLKNSQFLKLNSNQFETQMINPTTTKQKCYSIIKA